MQIRERKCNKVEKWLQDKTKLSGEGDPLGIVQEILFYSITKWYVYNSESVLDNNVHKSSLGFLIY